MCKTIKSALEKEKYLDLVQNQQIRKPFTGFGLAISQILTHKRRYVNVNGAALRCPLYKGKTENDVNLLTTCGWYPPEVYLSMDLSI